MNDVIKTLKDKFKSDKSTNIALLLGLAGIVLIGLSSLLGDKENKEETQIIKENAVYDDIAEDYRKTKTAELETLLESIQGVSEAHVMLNVTCSEEYVYARVEQNSSSSEENSFSSEYSYDYYSSDTSGDSVPVLTKVLNPQISSCAASCRGAENPNVCENIYLVISAALGLDINDIYVAPLG